MERVRGMVSHEESINLAWEILGVRCKYVTISVTSKTMRCVVWGMVHGSRKKGCIQLWGARSGIISKYSCTVTRQICVLPLDLLLLFT